jgi:hypothetical protein
MHLWLVFDVVSVLALAFVGWRVFEFIDKRLTAVETAITTGVASVVKAPVKPAA